MAFVLYKKFVEEEYALALTELLASRNIDFEVASDRDSLDSLYGDKPFKKEFFVKIKPQDFPGADAMMEALAKAQLQQVDPDHYLFSFSDDELLDILKKQDEWNEFDVQLAKKILTDRGKTITDDDVAVLRDERIADLAEADESKPVWTVVGYVSAAFGGILGMMIGWHMMTFKKTLPNGLRVYGFSKEDRNHGNIILIVGMIMSVGLTTYMLWKMSAD
jgi:hypothetical protein